MAGILYFIEGEPCNIVDAITEHGLGYALDPAHTTLVPIESSSPSGKPGFLLADNIANSDGEIMYRGKRQEWRKFRSVWVGYDTENRPTPGDLARLETVRGYAGRRQPVDCAANPSARRSLSTATRIGL